MLCNVFIYLQDNVSLLKQPRWTLSLEDFNQREKPDLLVIIHIENRKKRNEVIELHEKWGRISWIMEFGVNESKLNKNVNLKWLVRVQKIV